MMFDFCIPEAQRLADLTGANLDLDSALNYCNLHIEIDVEEKAISAHELIRRESTRQGLSRAAIVTALARDMKIEETLLRKRIDGIAFGERQFTTTKVAQRFKSR